MSACTIKPSTESWLDANSATPALIVKGIRSSQYRASSDLATAWTCSRAAPDDISGSSTPNSSPPNRPITPEGPITRSATSVK